MTFEFENEKQREAARLILSRTSHSPEPRKIQLSMLVISRTDYSTPTSASQFVKSFVNSPTTPVESQGDFVVRKDLGGKA